ncbi:hypothetical protein TrVE_jg1820 [Triparma verrucosa]|uniref:PH domain-containing protein n=1 Tax=Triparma verrucosa TaxID=1606542 RepID=A0A9W7F2F6_9STRA|nr:hypothetical protein TrVE_jg1820 [Triparma verrucosa]
MGCINTKPKSVLETIKDNYDKQDHDEGTGNPAMDLSPISMEGGDQASTPTREKSTSITEYISDRIRGLSSPPAPAPAAEVYFTPPFLFVGRRFKKHHRNTLGRMLSSQGRVLKLTKEGALAWYKTTSLTGIPDATESSEKEDGIIEVSSIRRIDRGYKTAVFAATGVEGTSNLAFSIITSERTLDLEAESEQVRDEWCEALEKHLKHGLNMVDIELGGDTAAAVLSPEEKMAKKQEERKKAYNAHSAEREKLRRARTSSQQRASTYTK